MKDFIDNFYSYDFTGILRNDEWSDDRGIEIDLKVLKKWKMMMMKKKLTKWNLLAL